MCMNGVENAKDNNRAMWNDVIVEQFLELCVVEYNAGNCEGSHFSRVGWKNIISKMNAITGSVWDRLQLKNKLDYLKKDWALWYKLLGTTTGIGWDPKKGTIDADDAWWKRQLLITPEASKFRKHPLQNLDKLDLLFRDSRVTGERELVPFARVMSGDSVRLNESVAADILVEESGESTGSGGLPGCPNSEETHGHVDGPTVSANKGKKRTTSMGQERKGKKIWGCRGFVSVN